MGNAQDRHHGQHLDRHGSRGSSSSDVSTLGGNRNSRAFDNVSLLSVDAVLTSYERRAFGELEAQAESDYTASSRSRSLTNPNTQQHQTHSGSLPHPVSPLAAAVDKHSDDLQTRRSASSLSDCDQLGEAGSLEDEEAAKWHEWTSRSEDEQEGDQSSNSSHLDQEEFDVDKLIGVSHDVTGTAGVGAERSKSNPESETGEVPVQNSVGAKMDVEHCKAKTVDTAYNPDIVINNTQDIDNGESDTTVESKLEVLVTSDSDIPVSPLSDATMSASSQGESGSVSQAEIIGDSEQHNSELEDSEDDVFSGSATDTPVGTPLVRSRPVSIDDLLDCLQETPVDELAEAHGRSKSLDNLDFAREKESPLSSRSQTPPPILSPPPVGLPMFSHLDDSEITVVNPEDYPHLHEITRSEPRSEPVTDLDDDSDDDDYQQAYFSSNDPDKTAARDEMTRLLMEMQQQFGMKDDDTEGDESDNEVYKERKVSHESMSSGGEYDTATMKIKGNATSGSDSSDDESGTDSEIERCQTEARYDSSSEDEIIQHINVEMIAKVINADDITVDLFADIKSEEEPTSPTEADQADTEKTPKEEEQVVEEIVEEVESIPEVTKETEQTQTIEEIGEMIVQAVIAEAVNIVKNTRNDAGQGEVEKKSDQEALEKIMTDAVVLRDKDKLLKKDQIEATEKDTIETSDDCKTKLKTDDDSTEKVDENEVTREADNDVEMDSKPKRSTEERMNDQVIEQSKNLETSPGSDDTKSELKEKEHKEEDLISKSLGTDKESLAAHEIKEDVSDQSKKDPIAITLVVEGTRDSIQPKVEIENTAPMATYSSPIEKEPEKEDKLEVEEEPEVTYMTNFGADVTTLVKSEQDKVDEAMINEVKTQPIAESISLSHDYNRENFEDIDETSIGEDSPIEIVRVLQTQVSEIQSTSGESQVATTEEASENLVKSDTETKDVSDVTPDNEPVPEVMSAEIVDDKDKDKPPEEAPKDDIVVDENKDSGNEKRLEETSEDNENRLKEMPQDSSPIETKADSVGKVAIMSADIIVKEEQIVLEAITEIDETSEVESAKKESKEESLKSDTTSPDAKAGQRVKLDVIVEEEQQEVMTVPPPLPSSLPPDAINTPKALHETHPQIPEHAGYSKQILKIITKKYPFKPMPKDREQQQQYKQMMRQIEAEVHDWIHASDEIRMDPTRASLRERKTSFPPPAKLTMQTQVPPPSAQSQASRRPPPHPALIPTKSEPRKELSRKELKRRESENRKSKKLKKKDKENESRMSQFAHFMKLGSLSKEHGKADTKKEEKEEKPTPQLPTDHGPPIQGRGEMVQRSVIIHRDERGYGLTVSGDNPVYVQCVKENGAAARVGVQEGDRIFKVNGTLVTSSNHVEVVKLIKCEYQKIT